MLYRKKAYLCSRFRKVKAVCKKSIAIRSLHLKFAKFYEEGRASMLSLDAYAIGSRLGISTGVRYVRIPHFLKGVWRYLVKDGHEYISLMPFFIVWTACWRLRAEQEVAPDTNQGRTNETKVSIYSDHGAIQPDQLHDNLLCNVKSILRQGSWQCSNRTKK